MLTKKVPMHRWKSLPLGMMGTVTQQANPKIKTVLIVKSRSQLFALENITKYARNHRNEAKETLKHILRMSNISDKIFENAVAKIKAYARIGLHFHPDRPDSTLKCVAEALLEQGIYKNQFETGIFELEGHRFEIIETGIYGYH